MIDNIAKFVMLKKSIEDVINSKNLIEIENVKEIKKTPYFRVYPISHYDLMNEGWEYPEGFDPIKGGTFSRGEYIGGKWGGIYLRAPDIFFTILEKGKDKFVKLGDISKITRGFTTGANEFFYLDENSQRKWQIEEEFLRPVIKSPKECRSIIIDPKDLKYKVFMCNKTKSELKGKNVLKYIEWGENAYIEIKKGSKKGKTIKGYQNLETTKSRNLWYSLARQEKQNILLLRFRDQRNWTPLVRNDILLISDVVFVGKYLENIDVEFMDAYLNSTIQILIIEIYGRKNLGEGLLTTYGPELRSLPVVSINTDKNKIKIMGIMEKLCSRDVKSIFEEIGINPSRPIREQEPQPLADRQELDNIIFDELELTQDERKEVYWSVCELVKQRSDTAKSLKK